MKCPRCSKSDTKVSDSRNSGNLRRRRRRCDSCGHKFSTTEFYGMRKEQDLPLLFDNQIRKRNNKTEGYDPAKLQKSIDYACRRTSFPADERTKLFDQLNARITDNRAEPVSSHEIIRWVFDAFSKVSPQAAVRYAGMYFDDDQFADELLAIGTRKSKIRKRRK